MHKVYKRDFVDMSKSNALFKRVVGGGLNLPFHVNTCQNIFVVGRSLVLHMQRWQFVCFCDLVQCLSVVYMPKDLKWTSVNNMIYCIHFVLLSSNFYCICAYISEQTSGNIWKDQCHTLGKFKGTQEKKGIQIWMFRLFFLGIVRHFSKNDLCATKVVL